VQFRGAPPPSCVRRSAELRRVYLPTRGFIPRNVTSCRIKRSLGCEIRTRGLAGADLSAASPRRHRAIPFNLHCSTAVINMLLRLARCVIRARLSVDTSTVFRVDKCARRCDGVLSRICFFSLYKHCLVSFINACPSWSPCRGIASPRSISAFRARLDSIEKFRPGARRIARARHSRQNHSRIATTVA